MADDRTLDEIYQYELKKRSSGEGIAMAAIGGDREEIKRFARLAIAAIEAKGVEQQGDVLAWLVYALSKVGAGVEPNAAFGWARKRRGAPSPSQDMAGLQKQWLIGQHMAGLCPQVESVRAAARVVAKQRNVSVEEAERCHRKFKDK